MSHIKYSGISSIKIGYTHGGWSRRVTIYLMYIHFQNLKKKYVLWVWHGLEWE